MHNALLGRPGRSGAGAPAPVGDIFWSVWTTATKCVNADRQFIDVCGQTDKCPTCKYAYMLNHIWRDDYHVLHMLLRTLRGGILS